MTLLAPRSSVISHMASRVSRPMTNLRTEHIRKIADRPRHYKACGPLPSLWAASPSPPRPMQEGKQPRSQAGGPGAVACSSTSSTTSTPCKSAGSASAGSSSSSSASKTTRRGSHTSPLRSRTSDQM